MSMNVNRCNSFHTEDAVELPHHSLNHWLSIKWEGLDNPVSSGASCAPEWLEGVEPSRPHSRADSRGKGISLDIPAYWRPSKGSQFFFLHFCVYGCLFGLVLICCSPGLWAVTLLLWLYFPLHSCTLFFFWSRLQNKMVTLQNKQQLEYNICWFQR